MPVNSALRASRQRQPEMTEIRLNMRIDEDEWPQLSMELANKSAKARAGRLRHLASLGLLLEQGILPVTLTGNVYPFQQDEKPDNNKAKAKKKGNLITNEDKSSSSNVGEEGSSILGECLNFSVA